MFVFDVLYYNLKEKYHRRNISNFNFLVLFLKMFIFDAVTFFSCLVLVQVTQFFSGSRYLWDGYFWGNIFPLNYQNVYGHQTCQDIDIWWGAPTHTFAWHLSGVVFLGGLFSFFYDLIIELSKNEKLEKYRIILSQHTNYVHKWLVHLKFGMLTASMFILFCEIPNYVQV